MKQEIKQRIDKIKLGEVPQGYKKFIIENDKSVIIPKEWDDKNTAGDVFDFYGSLSASREQLSNKGYCYLHYGDIHKSNKCVINVEKEIDLIPKLDIELSRVSKTSMLCDGDIVFVDASEDYEGASKHIVIENPTDIPFIAGLHTIVGKSKNNRLNNGYKKYCFQSNIVKNQFCFYLTGIKVYGLSKSNIQKIKFPLPHLTEQKKIAEILTTWDDAIDLKEKFIKALEERKKRLMRRLLSPIGEVKTDKCKWRTVKIGDVCQTFSGGTPLTSNLDFYQGNIPFIRSAEIGKVKTELFISENALNNSSAKKVEIGDLLYALYGANSGECAISKIGGAINQAILCIRSDELSITYLYYILLDSKDNITATYLQGGQGNLSAEIIKNIKILLPSITEQENIGNILLFADNEIELHKQEFEKLKLQKQSLMQLLLTGIVRVS